MTWGNRFKLLFGTLGVLAIVAACTVVFTQRQAEATSTSATITAQAYPIGTDYSGTVTAVSVKQGQQVVQGQPLVSVQSATLAADLHRGLVSRSSVGYSVTKKGLITFTAPVAGTVTSVTPVAGGFVQGGATLVSIDRGDSLTATAKYTLTSTDYGRLDAGAPVELILPDQSTLAGKVSRISVTTTAAGQAQAAVVVTSSGLKQGARHGLVAAGTPVTARVHLRDDGVFAGVQDHALALVRKIGL